MNTLTIDALMLLAQETARAGMADGLGGPFGAVVAKNGELISTGANRVVRDKDPTAHAEMVAIREACRTLGDHRLEGCEIFCTCEPCPMCLSAIFWARIDRIYFAATRHDAADAGFDDAAIYREVSSDLSNRTLPIIHLPSKASLSLFEDWRHMADKILY
jgi:tRNA(Arg) A34 adenosine deaminase TadA